MIRWFDRHAGWLMAALSILCLFVWVMLMTGCGGLRSPQQDGGGSQPMGLAATLAVLGSTLTWSGAIAVSLGAVARLALPIVAPALAPFAWVGSLVGAWGLCAAGIGLSCTFLANNLLLLGLAVAASLAVVVWWHWPDLRHALDRRMAGKRTLGA